MEEGAGLGLTGEGGSRALGEKQDMRVGQEAGGQDNAEESERTRKGWSCWSLRPRI